MTQTRTKNRTPVLKELCERGDVGAWQKETWLVVFGAVRGYSSRSGKGRLKEGCME